MITHEVPTARRPVTREILPAVANSLPVRAAFNSVPTAVAALCAMVDGEPRGLVATSLSVGVSYDPPMVSFSVLNSSTTWPVLRRAVRIGVSVLSDAQAATCLQIASKTGNRFAGLETVTSPDGALFVNGATSWLDCSIEAEVGAGDHHLVVLRVHGVSTVDEDEPLVFHRADFRRLVVGPPTRGKV